MAMKPRNKAAIKNTLSAAVYFSTKIIWERQAFISSTQQLLKYATLNAKSNIEY